MQSVEKSSHHASDIYLYTMLCNYGYNQYRNNNIMNDKYDIILDRIHYIAIGTDTIAIVHVFID